MPEKKKMRVDRRKNAEKVVKARLRKPLSTTREIAKIAKIDHWTVARIDKEIPQIATKDDRIITLTETDFDIVTLAQMRIKEKLEDEEEMKKTRIGEISGVAKESAARYNIFRWDLTGADGWYKIKDMTNEQLLALARWWQA